MRLAVPGAFPAIHAHSPLVTSSRALAGIASQQFARTQLASGALSWERPEIYTFEAWLTSIWLEARYAKPDLPTLLSPAQEHFLWRQIVTQDQPNLFDLDSLARLASKAADTLVDYRIDLNDEAWTEQHDAQEFHNWYSRFRERCRAEGWMSRREILTRLTPASRPLFIGFDELPARGTLLSMPHTARAQRLELKQVESTRDELEFAARWARARFEADAGQSIAIFVPGLRLQTALVERVFRSVFYPARALRLQPEPAESVFHIHAPAPLIDHPLIASALLLLELARPRISQSDATAILRSPFVKGAIEERVLRASADLNLRRTRELDFSLRELAWISRTCPQLESVWKRVGKVLERQQAANDFPRWARLFADLPQAAGWPGDLELTAEEQHIVEMWKDALSGLSSLGMISSHVDFDTALGQLRRLLAIGGPETGDWSSPVQILDSADAPGLEFDAAFLTGINDETWPSAEIPTSLIPARLQRAAGVPEADPRNVRTLGINATRALVHAAPLIAGAYHDRLAPQVRACARVARLSSGVWTGKTPLESFSPTQMEEFRETSGPAFDTTREARGGTRVIKAQSECPFKAFAETRLRAVLPEDASFGFDALDRGKFVHVALEYVWRELKTQAALLATSPDDLLGLVRRSVDHALANQDTTEFYLQTSAVERERLERLIYDWLTTVERQRTVPFTVESAEQEIHITIGGLPLRVRLDRIDRLPNGAVVLIDYKTGAGINKNRLAGDRPAEPQLLIYAAAQAGPVDGLLFGCVVPRDLRYAGFTRGKLLSSTTVTPHKQWDEFLEESRENVEKLAAEYVRGEAVINPSRHNCQYCDLAMLCRKDEQQALAEDGE